MATLKQRLIALETARPAKVESDDVFYTEGDRAIVMAYWRDNGEPDMLPEFPRPYDPNLTVVQNELFDLIVSAFAEI